MKITILLAVLLAVDSARGVLNKKTAEVDLKIKNPPLKPLKHAQDRISSFPHGKFGLPKFNFDSFSLSEYHYRPKKFAPKIELPSLNSLPYASGNGLNFFRKPSFLHPSFSLGTRHPGLNNWRTGFKSHTSVIPISLEAYGPPNKPALPSFSSGSSPFVQNPNHNHGFPQNGFFNNELSHSPLQNNALAPPTQPDIKYDGWQPIAGNIVAPSLEQAPAFQDNVPQPIFHDSNAAVLNFDTNVPPYPDSGNVPQNFQDNIPQQVFHDTGSSPTNNGPSSLLNPEFGSAPSDSYGEPIFNPEDHNLKQSVRSRDETALPPPPLPEQEPFHVQGQPDTGVPSLPNPQEQVKHAGPAGPGQGPINPYPVQEDSYLSPPPSSFASDGPYPSARKPFSGPPGPDFGFIRTPNFRAPSRPANHPQMLFPVSLTPPRTLAPVQFRQQDQNYGSHSAASEYFENYNVPSESLPLEKDNCNDKPHNHLDSDVSMSYNQIVVSEDSRANKISGDPLPGLPSENNYAGLSDADEANNKVQQGQSAQDYGNPEPVNQQFKQEAIAISQNGNDDGYQIQGTKGVYSFQIQPADGSQGTEDSDSSIRHEQLLSDGLLQNILAAIEQPGSENANDQSAYQPQIAASFDLSAASSQLALSAGDNQDSLPLNDKSEQALFGESHN
ncbi:uncharacterized protein LOC141528406 [Cotesia typhae]|uniref:uncharacterized protein LOC141528406 n=1 Tax=Cotesia typhae TaxID=2053667 RepID=UPI003D68187E